MDSNQIIGPASNADVPGIAAALQANKSDPSLFQRSEVDIRSHLGDFVVARDGSGVVLGCAAIHAYSRDVGEILSVAVLPDVQGRKLGAHLVEECLRLAERTGLKTVWLATLKPDYFSRFGFQPISRWRLPASILLYKLAQVFRQAPRYWFPSLLGAQTFMERQVKTD